VSDGGGEPAGGGQLLALPQRRLRELPLRDVLRRSDHAGNLLRSGAKGGHATGGDPCLASIRELDAILRRIQAAGRKRLLQLQDGGHHVFLIHDAFAQSGSGDGHVRLRPEQLSGALIEIKQVGGAIPCPCAHLSAFESLAKTLGGLALQAACRIGEGDFPVKVLCQSHIVDGDGGLCGDRGNKVLALQLEDIGRRMAVEQASKHLAPAAAHWNGKIAAYGWMPSGHTAERVTQPIAAVFRDVSRTKDAAAEERLGEDGGGARHGEPAERHRVQPADLVELVGLSLFADVVVEEGTKHRP
jgi:hypothetical protein